MKTLLISSLLVLTACAPKQSNLEPAPMAQVELPSAESLFDASIVASNQAETLGKLTSMRVHSIMRIPQAGIEGEIHMSWASPTKILVEQNIPGIGSGRVGFNGETGWSSDNMMGPRIIEGKELEELLFDSSMDSDLNFREWYTDLTTVELTDFKGIPAYKVNATTRFGREDTVYFAVESGLGIGASHQVESPMGAMVMEIFYSEWSDFDGIMMPKMNEIATGPVVMEMEVLSIEQNPEFAEGLFELPPEIQELVEEEEQAQEEADTEQSAEESPTESP